MRKKFSGLIVPAITPVLQDGTLDENAFRYHIRDLIGRGVDGLYITGTTGEAAQLPFHTWKEANRIAIEEANRTSSQVYNGAVAPGTLETIERIHILEELGAKAVFATPMFYASGVSQQQILLHYQKICKATALDVVVYSISFTTNVNIETDTLAQIAELENVIGVKDTRLDWGTHMNNLRALKETKVGIACVPEPFIAASLLLGADGIVSALANFLPELYLMAIDAAERNDRDALMRCFDKIMEFDRVLRCPTGSGLAGFKYLLSLLNGGSPCTALTAEPLTKEQEVVFGKAKEYILATRKVLAHN